MGLLENIVIVALFAFILVISVMSHFEIKKDCKGLIKATIRSYDPKSTGRAVLRWQIIVLCLEGIFVGHLFVTYLLLLSVLISERLIVYRAVRPNDKLSLFLAKLNW